MRFVLSLIVITGATIGIVMNVSHDFLAPLEENIVWMKEGKVESAASGGVRLAFAPAGAEIDTPVEYAEAPPLQFGFAGSARSFAPSAGTGGPTGVIESQDGATRQERPMVFHEPVVIDAGRLETASTLIILDGIVALGRNQTCRSQDGNQWLCGEQAAVALTNLIGSKPVECDPPSDQPSRVTASGLYSEIYRTRCRVRGVDLSRWLVAKGWAEALDPQLAGQAWTARKERVGQWNPSGGN